MHHRPPPVWPAHLFGNVWEDVPEGRVQEVRRALRVGVAPPSERFIDEVALPLAGWLVHEARSKPLIVAFGGTPGSGKSTLVDVLRHLLAELFGRSAEGFSLDDVYLTRAERQRLARDIHPLLATRGVPGTHDLELAHRLLDALSEASAAHPVWLPRFDKVQDDRAPPARWHRVDRPPEILLLDGWFWGARPIGETPLEPPLNEREAQEDADGTWRRWVHEQLLGPYQRFFARAHFHVQLQAPSWRTTIEWRLAREMNLLGLDGPPSEELRTRVGRFLQLFERIARLPSARGPDLIVALDERHELGALAGAAL